MLVLLNVNCTWARHLTVTQKATTTDDKMLKNAGSSLFRPGNPEKRLIETHKETLKCTADTTVT